MRVLRVAIFLEKATDMYPEKRFPSYRLPRAVLADLILAALLHQHRSFRIHAQRMMPGVYPPLRVSGESHIPEKGPGVITCNHYFRPGFWSPWFPAAISASVPVDIYWIMTNAFTYPGQRLGRFRRRLSRLVLDEIARIYGFNRMPPMPPSPDESSQRTAAIRKLMGRVREYPSLLIGIAPEGGDQPGGRLAYPPEGFGRLAMALAHRGLPFYPIGVYEENGCLNLVFGKAYWLDDHQGADRATIDRLASIRVMDAIAACLPERLRGAFPLRSYSG